ncbi:MAG: hypothetical protein KatS3mg085_702 [Candidatus Dojkabacteria bacterium]|nr:MAG: hypothetical protein KatS3mg085_702 [Candidatus Dojkabacteria bacterium]
MKKNLLFVVVAFMLVSSAILAFFVFQNQSDDDSLDSSAKDGNEVQEESKESVSNTDVKFTLEEVAMHNSESDCYVVYDEKVYDVTDYAKKHPGGAEAIFKNCGKDITQVFDNVGAHNSVQPQDWQEYYIGDLE